MTETYEAPLSGLKKLGQQLKQARKVKNLSLERVAEITRIHIGVLKNIEEGQIGEHPGPVFLKGFLRTYGELVELDSKYLQKELYTIPELNEEVVLQGTSILPIESEPTFWQGQKILLLFLIVVGLGGGFFLYDYFNENTGQPPNELQTDERQTLDIPTQNELSESLFQEEPPSIADEQSSVPEQITSSPSETQEEAEQFTETQMLPPALFETVPVTDFDEEILTETVLEDSIPTPPKAELLVLLIKASLSTWINIRIDEENPLDISLQSGEDYTLEAKERYILTIGNTKGLELFLNGHPQLIDDQNELLVNWTLDKSTILNSELPDPFPGN